jgi:hypothetical protein
MHMNRVLVSVLFFFSCSRGVSKPAVSPSEPFFQQIRMVNANEAARCQPLESVETHIDAGHLTPPIPPEEYRRTRRVAFSNFEGKVLAAGGNAVLMREFRERGSAGTAPFLLNEVHLSGRALLCPTN